MSSASGHTSRGDSLSSSTASSAAATQRVMEFVYHRTHPASGDSLSHFPVDLEPDVTSSSLRRDSFSVVGSAASPPRTSVGSYRGSGGVGSPPSALPDFSMFYDSTTTVTPLLAGSTVPSSSPSIVKEFTSHKQEVCGLKWSFDEKMLASGGNDNKLFIWDVQAGRPTDPLCSFEEHTAAVKAVAWSPHQHGLVASGGGTADRHIRFWNANTGVALHKIDTGSQVSGSWIICSIVSHSPLLGV